MSPSIQCTTLSGVLFACRLDSPNGVSSRIRLLSLPDSSIHHYCRALLGLGMTAYNYATGNDAPAGGNGLMNQATNLWNSFNGGANQQGGIPDLFGNINTNTRTRRSTRASKKQQNNNAAAGVDPMAFVKSYMNGDGVVNAVWDQVKKGMENANAVPVDEGRRKGKKATYRR